MLSADTLAPVSVAFHGTPGRFVAKCLPATLNRIAGWFRDFNELHSDALIAMGKYGIIRAPPMGHEKAVEVLEASNGQC